MSLALYTAVYLCKCRLYMGMPRLSTGSSIVYCYEEPSLRILLGPNCF